RAARSGSYSQPLQGWRGAPAAVDRIRPVRKLSASTCEIHARWLFRLRKRNSWARLRASNQVQFAGGCDNICGGSGRISSAILAVFDQNGKRNPPRGLPIRRESDKPGVRGI